METKTKEETIAKTINIERIQDGVNSKFWGLAQEVEAYYSFRQKRHRACGDVSQNASAVYKDTLRVIRNAYFSPYFPEIGSSDTMLLDYRAIPVIKNEMAGLFLVNDAVLRKMFILSSSEHLSDMHIQEIRASVIGEAIRYFRKPSLSSFSRESNFDFFKTPISQALKPSL